MTVVQFCNTLSSADGGPSRHAIEVNLALNRIGEPAVLLAARSSTDSLMVHYSSNRSLPRLPPMSFRDALRSGELGARMRAARQARTWIVHGYFLAWIPLVVILGRLSGKRVLLMPHGALTQYDLSRSHRKKDLFARFFGWWVNRIVVFVVATSTEARELPSSARAGRVFVVGAGASIPAAPVVSRDVHQPLQLVSVSRLAPKKRLDLAIATVKELRAQGVEAVLRIAGTGTAEQEARLRQLVSELDLVDRVFFLGQVEGEAKERLLEESDVFLLLSEDENFGIGLAEALAHGLPVVATDAVASAEGLPSEAGVLLSAARPIDAAGAVQLLVNRYSDRRQVAAAYARSTFAWDAVAERWRLAMSAA